MDPEQQQQQGIQEFVRKRAPAVLAEANLQQAAHLNTPEARAGTAERMRQWHERDWEEQQADVPERHKRCLYRHTPNHGITCDADSKPLSAVYFHRRASSSDGYAYTCKRCARLYRAVRPCLARSMCLSYHVCKVDEADLFSICERPGTAALQTTLYSDMCTAQWLREKADAERLAGDGPPRKKRDKGKPLLDEDWDPFLCEHLGLEPRMPACGYGAAAGG